MQECIMYIILRTEEFGCLVKRHEIIRYWDEFQTKLDEVP